MVYWVATLPRLAEENGVPLYDILTSLAVQRAFVTSIAASGVEG